MLRYVDSKKMGRGMHDWLRSHFHFSFAEYYNPKNISFGVLRVINDDEVQPGTGFEMHPHRDMEIISYVVDGELTHADSMQNRQTLKRGEVQYMSAGTGVVHSEHNLGSDLLRFLQIWIFPEKKGEKPNYGDYRFPFEARANKWLPIATWTDNKDNSAPIKIHADINAYACTLAAGEALDFEVAKGRQAYLVLIEGKADINGEKLGKRDALEIKEENITVKAQEFSHMFVIEMSGEE